MPEKIALKGDSVASRFLVAAASKTNGINLRGKLLVSVSLTIDGIELPFEATLEQMATEFQGAVDHKARDAALEMLTDAGLADAVARLTEARKHLRAVIQELEARAPSSAKVERP